MPTVPSYNHQNNLPEKRKCFDRIYFMFNYQLMWQSIKKTPVTTSLQSNVWENNYYAVCNEMKSWVTEMKW